MLDQLPLIDGYFPWFFPGLTFVLGAIVGSFLNVCIYRIPAEKSIVHPGSQCACGKPIAWFDNIPILSWFILRGKARCCGRPYSFRYPFVEALTGFLFLSCWFTFGGFTPVALATVLAGFIFVAILICATFIDLDHMIIPDRFSIGGMVAGVVLAALAPALHSHDPGMMPLINSMRSIIEAITGAFIGSALVLWIALLGTIVFKKEAMGFGDVKLLGCIGAFCGWQGGIFAVFGGALIGCAGLLVCAPFMLRKQSPPKPEADQATSPSPPENEADTAAAEKVTCPDCGFEFVPGEELPDEGIGKMRIPFGPMLALGGIIYFLWAREPVDAYFAEAATTLFSDQFWYR